MWEYGTLLTPFFSSFTCPLFLHLPAAGGRRLGFLRSGGIASGLPAALPRPPARAKLCCLTEERATASAGSRPSGGGQQLRAVFPAAAPGRSPRPAPVREGGALKARSGRGCGLTGAPCRAARTGAVFTFRGRGAEFRGGVRALAGRALGCAGGGIGSGGRRGRAPRPP